MPSTPADPERVLRELGLLAEFVNSSMLAHTLGARIDFPEGKRVRLRVEEVRPEHRGGFGTEAVNGAVLSGLLDLALGFTPALSDPRRRSATMQLSISFEEPVRGNSLTAEAWATRVGERIVFATGHILDEEGRVCVNCQGLVRRLGTEWANAHGLAAK